MTRASITVAWLVAMFATARGGPRTERIGFDHRAHASAGAPEIACTRCHTVKAGLVVGRPDHAACFAACHGPAPTRDPVAAERYPLCNPCHAETVLATPKLAKSVGYPPYALAVDHGLAFGHKAHAATACARCHEVGPKTNRRAADRRRVPHQRCVACHEAGAAPAMAACASCHTQGDRVQLARTKPDGRAFELVVSSAFSHAKHAPRGAAKQCATCHRAVVESNDPAVPRPTADGCAIAGCHDDKAAFGITSGCTKCHRDVPTTKFKVARPDKRFSHLAHDQAQLPCAACHPLGKTGEVLVSNHAPCATCHVVDFGLREPTICGSCHNATEPWRHLVPDRLPAEITEFGATLDHAKHPGACTSCHAIATATSELRPPRGHAACTTTGCHAIATGPAPRLSECETCHRRGLADQRDRLRRTATWSVRAAFVHAPHRKDNGAELACTACHTDLTSPNVLSLAVPEKQTCARCHDGKAAFKLTGTSCMRCHPGSR